MQALLQPLFQYLAQFGPLSHRLREALMMEVFPRHPRAKEVLLRRGTVCQEMYFVVSGSIAWEDGSGRTVYLTTAGQPLIKYSFERQVPSAFTLVAVEPTDLLCLSYPSLMALDVSYRKLITYTRQVRAEQLHSMALMMLIARIEDPRVRLRELKLFYGPHILSMPRERLASLLNVSRTELYRLLGH